MNKKVQVKIFVFVLLMFSFCLYAQNNSNKSEKQNPVKIYNQALSYFEDEDYYTASQYFLEVVTINPAYSDAWFNLARCSYQLGEYDLAFRYLESAEKFEKNNSKIQNLKGMILLALGNLDEAKIIFESVLKHFPNDVDAHFGLAEIELFDGKYSGAENQYVEALKRQSTNRKALLSLALICAQTNRYDVAQNYLHQAMQFYSGEAEVHYLAAIIYMMEGEFSLAEKHARIAVEIKGNYEKAYELLANAMYCQKRYSEVIDLCDYLISKNRNNTAFWYLKGISLEKMGNKEDAVDVWDTALNINPQDEIMRMMLELTVKDILSFDDPRRTDFAEYHLENANQYITRYDNAGSSYELQRAIMLDPSNVKARLKYAEILEMNGMHESYLSQLNFIQENSEIVLDTALQDKIEAYDSLLQDNLAKKWKIDPFYLDKIRWNIAIFYTENQSSFIHADTERLTALACSDIFSGVAITAVKTQVNPVSGFGEAFRNARANDYDYFIIVSLSESSDDITLNSKMYSGRTGTEIASEKFFATGNNRFSQVLRRFRNSVLEKLTVRGKILKRNGKTVLIDLGKSENIVKDAEFKIIKKGCIKTSDYGTGLFYKDDDVIGILTVTNAGEEISEAQITNNGFYDRINVDDEVVLVSIPSQNNEAGVDTVPNSDENGNPVVNNSVQSESSQIIDEIKKAVERPAILEILRNIR